MMIRNKHRKPPRKKGKPAPNPLRIDPTRTAGLRRKLSADLTRRFARLRFEVVKLLVDEDALGLVPRPTFNAVTANATSWRGMTDPEKVRAFREWLKRQVQQHITGQTEEALWRRYVEEGFRKGAGRAFDDTRPAVRRAMGRDQEAVRDFYAGTKDEFLRSAFGRPVAVEKVKLLAARSFDELEGVTAEMGRKMTRTLTDGLVQGKSPREIARELVVPVDSYKGRALNIARNEISRAHAEGQLTALEELGVEEVGVSVEWVVSGLGTTALGNPSPCDVCAPMQGVILTIAEARGMIPRHPGCL